MEVGLTTIKTPIFFLLAGKRTSIMCNKFVHDCRKTKQNIMYGRVRTLWGSCAVAFWPLYGRYGRSRTVMYGRMVNPGPEGPFQGGTGRFNAKVKNHFLWKRCIQALAGGGAEARRAGDCLAFRAAHEAGGS